MKILLILAIAMAGGLALSRLMKLLNLPNVTGYLIAGILIGPFVLKLVTNVDIKSAKIITTTALGFIAFSIGGEFKLSLLKKLGGKIVVITVVQAVMTVLLVLLALLLVPGERRVWRDLPQFFCALQNCGWCNDGHSQPNDRLPASLRKNHIADHRCPDYNHQPGLVPHQL